MFSKSASPQIVYAEDARLIETCYVDGSFGAGFSRRCVYYGCGLWRIYSIRMHFRYNRRLKPPLIFALVAKVSACIEEHFPHFLPGSRFKLTGKRATVTPEE